MEGYKVEKSGLSRREFLRNLLKFGASGFVVYNLPLQILDEDPESLKIFIEALGKFMSIPDPKGSALLENVNIAWQNYLDHNVITPDIAHGSFTFFGESAVSDAQFFIQTDQMRIDKANGGILTPSQENLLRIRDDYDVNSLFDVNDSPEEYIEAFHIWLMRQGFYGVIALKSPNDFGSIGLIQVWNPVAEAWAGPFRVIVLNTATYETFNQWSNNVNQFPNTNLQFSWLGDISFELLEASGIGTGAEDQTGIIVRWMSDVVNSVTQGYMENIIYPEIEIVPAPINQSSRIFGESLSKILRETSSLDIFNLFSEFYNYKDYKDGYIFHYVNSDEPTELILPPQFMSYIMTNIGVGIYRDIDRTGIVTSVLDPSNPPIGFPMAPVAEHLFLEKLYQGGAINRKIHYPNLREENLSDVNNGVFILEEMPNPYHPTSFIAIGFIVTIGLEKRLLSMMDYPDPQNINLDVFSSRYLNTHNRRLLIYY